MSSPELAWGDISARTYVVTDSEVWLLVIYAKAELDSIAGEVLREMEDEIEKALG